MGFERHIGGPAGLEDAVGKSARLVMLHTSYLPVFEELEALWEKTRSAPVETAIDRERKLALRCVRSDLKRAPARPPLTLIVSAN